MRIFSRKEFVRFFINKDWGAKKLYSQRFTREWGDTKITLYQVEKEFGMVEAQIIENGKIWIFTKTHVVVIDEWDGAEILKGYPRNPEVILNRQVIASSR